MTDPKRLLETRELGELGKSALGAAVELEPPDGARERVWSDLGAKLPYAGDPTSDLASDAGGAGPLAGAAGGAAATGGASALGVTLAKVAGGLVALGAIAGGGLAATRAFDAGQPNAAPAVSAPAVAPKAAEPLAAPLAAAPHPPADSAPEVPPTAAVEAPKTALAAPIGGSVPVTEREAARSPNQRSGAAEGTAAMPNTASFPSTDEGAKPGKAEFPDLGAAAREESRLVGAAREALRSGNARSALALLDQARTRFPAGVLGQERAALGIEALVQSGARAEASERARRFLTAFPNSPHAARVRALIATSPTP